MLKSPGYPVIFLRFTDNTQLAVEPESPENPPAPPEESVVNVSEMVENAENRPEKSKSGEMVHGMQRDEYLKMPRSEKIKVLRQSMKAEEFNRMFGKKSNVQKCSTVQALDRIQITVPEVELNSHKNGSLLYISRRYSNPKPDSFCNYSEKVQESAKSPIEKKPNKKFKAKEIPPNTFLNLYEEMTIKETLRKQTKQQKSKYAI